MNSTPTSNTTTIRSNSNAVLFRHQYIDALGNDSVTYSIYDNRGQVTTYASDRRESITQTWNRNYRNSRQYVTPNGVNHRYMS